MSERIRQKLKQSLLSYDVSKMKQTIQGLNEKVSALEITRL